MTAEQLNGCLAIINSHPRVEQEQKTMEECVELANAVKDYSKGKIPLEAVVDEIADVMIMCNQLMLMYDCEAAVDERIDFKIDRTLGYTP